MSFGRLTKSRLLAARAMRWNMWPATPQLTPDPPGLSCVPALLAARSAAGWVAWWACLAGRAAGRCLTQQGDWLVWPSARQAALAPTSRPNLRKQPEIKPASDGRAAVNCRAAVLLFNFKPCGDRRFSSQGDNGNTLGAFDYFERAFGFQFIASLNQVNARFF